MTPFSVLMSIHDGEDSGFFRSSLESLVYQECLPNQVVVVQDGRLGAKLESVIDEFGDILNICSPKLANKSGLGAALNVGLRHCEHELVARLDSDDIAFPERFKIQLEAFEVNPTLDVIGGFAQEIDPEGNLGEIRVMPLTHEAIYDSLWACPLIHPSVMYRKSRILSISGYDPNFKRRQDYDLWFRCAIEGFRFQNLSKVLIYYRFSPSTHKRQSSKILFKQGCIGMKSVVKLRQPLWKGVASFFPLFRSVLPSGLANLVYRNFNRFDPRKR